MSKPHQQAKQLTKGAEPALMPADMSLAGANPADLERHLTELATQLGLACAADGQLLATAESCTGGMIARALTDTAGSSAWMDSGYVTYSNEAKMALLGVPAQALTDHGAVSEPVARAMALGALSGGRAQLSMAVTGVAGPGGGSVDKPVGTVWFGWAGPGFVRAQRVKFDGDRHAVRLQTAIHALFQLKHLNQAG